MKRIAQLFAAGLVVGTFLAFGWLALPARAQVPTIGDFAQCAPGRVCVTTAIQTQGGDGGTQADFSAGGVIVGDSVLASTIPTCNAARRGEIRMVQAADAGSDRLCFCIADAGVDFRWCSITIAGTANGVTCANGGSATVCP